MHLKDIATRIDPTDSSHSELKSHIDTYLQ
jgi:hypothetical protein